MQLLVVRHAIAKQRVPGASDTDDAQRRLTANGARKMRRAGKGLRLLVPAIDLLATSPLIRAAETAEILSATYGGGLKVVQTSVLSPGEPPEAFADWITRQPWSGTAAVVGHEPELSVLVSWLLCGATRSVVELKKGAACLLDCPAGAAASTATLLWSLRPGHLRELRG